MMNTNTPEPLVSEKSNLKKEKAEAAEKTEMKRKTELHEFEEWIKSFESVAFALLLWYPPNATGLQCLQILICYFFVLICLSIRVLASKGPLPYYYWWVCSFEGAAIMISLVMNVYGIGSSRIVLLTLYFIPNLVFYIMTLPSKPLASDTNWIDFMKRIFLAASITDWINVINKIIVKASITTSPKEEMKKDGVKVGDDDLEKLDDELVMEGRADEDHCGDTRLVERDGVKDVVALIEKYEAEKKKREEERKHIISELNNAMYTMQQLKNVFDQDRRSWEEEKAYLILNCSASAIEKSMVLEEEKKELVREFELERRRWEEERGQLNDRRRLAALNLVRECHKECKRLKDQLEDKLQSSKYYRRAFIESENLRHTLTDQYNDVVYSLEISQADVEHYQLLLHLYYTHFHNQRHNQTVLAPQQHQQAPASHCAYSCCNSHASS